MRRGSSIYRPRAHVRPTIFSPHLPPYTQASSSKTGKHGGCKISVYGVDIFSHKKVQDMHMSGQSVFMPRVDKRTLPCLGFDMEASAANDYADDDSSSTSSSSSSGNAEHIVTPDSQRAFARVLDGREQRSVAVTPELVAKLGSLLETSEVTVTVMRCCGRELIVEAK